MCKKNREKARGVQQAQGLCPVGRIPSPSESACAHGVGAGACRGCVPGAASEGRGAWALRFGTGAVAHGVGAAGALEGRGLCTMCKGACVPGLWAGNVLGVGTLGVGWHRPWAVAVAGTGVGLRIEWSVRVCACVGVARTDDWLGRFGSKEREARRPDSDLYCE